MNAIQLQNKRTGSTFLQVALNSHPDIVGFDEVFVNRAKFGIKKSGINPYVVTTYNGFSQIEGYIKGEIWGRHPGKHVTFKLMYNQIDYHKGLRGFIRDNKIPIIHLMRRNLVRQVVSYIKQTKIETFLTPDSLFRHVVNADQEASKWESEFYDHKRLSVFYEDIIGKTEGEFTFVAPGYNRDLCDFFGVSHRSLLADTKKSNTNIWDYIPDRQGAIDKLKGTKYQWMIEEE